jgi:hypothetical protein
MGNFDFSQRVTVPDFVMFRQLSGESILLNLNNEQYFGLDDVGTRMWLSLTQSGSIEEAYQRLLGEYEVDAQELRRDLTELVQNLSTQGLVEIVDAAA